MILSISKNNHDASYCILDYDGKVIYYTQEERFSRKKHSSIYDDSFIDHVNDKLEYFNIQTINVLLLSNCFRSVRDKLGLTNLVKRLKAEVQQGKLENTLHHKFHAWCGHSFSNFDEAVCLVIDGWGSRIKIDTFSGYETTSIYEISKQNQIKTLYKRLNYDPQRFEIVNKDFIKSKVDYDIDITQRLDIGVMYGTISRHLGFNVLDAGKTMGLSAYGNYDNKIPNMLIQNKYCNMNLFKNDRQLDTDLYPFLKNLNLKQRQNLAFSIQKNPENYFIECVKYIKSKSNIKNIILSGGCALNVCANSEIKKQFPDYNIFVDPIASDAGQSIGCAKMWYNENIKDFKVLKEKHIYLNTPYNKDTITQDLKKYEING